MKDVIRGKAFVLGDNIDTDQIIPAKHLVYSLADPEERRNFGKFALSGLPDQQSGLPQGWVRFVEEGEDRSPFAIVVAGKNFGCGSSREHAPVSLQIAGVEAVVAKSFARIFYRNSVDGGFFVPLESEEDLSEVVRTGDEIEIETGTGQFRNLKNGKTHRLKPLGDVADILRAGDVFAYARKSGLLK